MTVRHFDRRADCCACLRLTRRMLSEARSNTGLREQRKRVKYPGQGIEGRPGNEASKRARALLIRVKPLSRQRYRLSGSFTPVYPKWSASRTAAGRLGMMTGFVFVAVAVDVRRCFVSSFVIDATSQTVVSRKLFSQRPRGESGRNPVSNPNASVAIDSRPSRLNVSGKWRVTGVCPRRNIEVVFCWDGAL